MAGCKCRRLFPAVAIRVAALIVAALVCPKCIWAATQMEAQSTVTSQAQPQGGRHIRHTVYKAGGRRIVEIRFERSGGFAGRATNVAGVAHLIGGSPAVTCESSGYSRPLNSTEAASLHQLAVAALAGSGKLAAPGTPDAFQYAVSIQTGNGSSTSLTLGTPGEGEAQGDSVSSLGAWVVRETGRIWEDKLAKIRK